MMGFWLGIRGLRDKGMEESKILILIDKIFNFLNWVDWLIIVFIIIVIIFLFWKYRSKADKIIQILIVLTTIIGILITTYYTKTTSEKNLKLQKEQFEKQIKEQERINKEQLSLQKSNTEAELLQNKINSCIDLRTKDRTITDFESDGYDDKGNKKGKEVKKDLIGLTLNQAGYVCNAFYGNFEGVKQFFQEEFLYIPIDENDERSIFHITNIDNYKEIMEYIINHKLFYYNKYVFETFSKNKKYTPLMYAVIDNNLDAVKYLLSKGVEIDTRVPDHNSLGDTAFTLAVGYKRREIAKYLKDEGANINIRLGGLFLGRNIFANLFTLDKEKLDIILDLGIDPIIKVEEYSYNSLYEILSIVDNKLKS